MQMAPSSEMGLRSIELQGSARALNRRVSSVAIRSHGATGLVCDVKIGSGTTDQYGGIAVPFTAPGATAYRVEFSLKSPEAVRAIYFQIVGDDGDLRWVWDCAKQPAAKGTHSVIFIPGEAAGPFAVHERAAAKIAESRRLQFYVRPKRTNGAVSFTIRSISAATEANR